jgi:hypothetical protein
MNCSTPIRNIVAALLLVSGTGAAAVAQQPSPAGGRAGAEEQPAQPRFGLSVNAGLIFSYTDVKPSKSAPVFGIGAGYFAAPYLHLHIDLQKGWLKGGEPVNDGLHLMGSDNSFIAATLTARFLPLGLLSSKDHNEALRIFSGLYAGTGLGFISNSVKSNSISSPDYGALGKYSGASAMLPIEAGIDIPVARLSGNKRLMINLNYRVNLCFSDKIDGYVPTVPANKKNDAFNALTAGLVFNF